MKIHMKGVVPFFRRTAISTYRYFDSVEISASSNNWRVRYFDKNVPFFRQVTTSYDKLHRDAKIHVRSGVSTNSVRASFHFFLNF